MSHYENTTSDTVTADLTKTTRLRRTPHMLKKSRSLEDSEHSFEGGANSELVGVLTEATWNSKVKYPSLALPLNILFLLLIFIGGGVQFL